MQFFRLLHRQTKSESDVATLASQTAQKVVTAPVFVPFEASLPSFDPARELYGLFTTLPQTSMDPTHIDKLDAKIKRLESQVARLQDERSALERDLADYRSDLLLTRAEHYSEMLCSARRQQCAMDDFRSIQKLETRHQRFCNLLVDIGIPRPTVDSICEAIQSGHRSPEGMLVDAIKNASNNSDTLLSRLKPVVMEERTPEHYQSALNLTLNIRKELRSQKKQSKFWKKLAQENDRHANTITPSPSDISSIRQELSPERQSAVDALIARRRAARYSDNIDNDVFGGKRRESALDTLANSLASRPRHSIPDDLRLSSSFSSSGSSASTYFSGISRNPRDSTSDTPNVSSRLPSPLSTSLRRSSRGSSQSVVLGSINLNVSRSSSVDQVLPEETEEQTNPNIALGSTVTYSQDLPQNDRRAFQGHGHRRVSSTASRRSTNIRSTRTSFRLSAFSPLLGHRSSGPVIVPHSDVSEKTTVNALSLHTPNIMMRFSDLTNSDTPASSEDTPFKDARAPSKFRSDTPLSLTDLESRVASTPSDGSVACRPLDRSTCPHDTRFLEHLDTSTSTSLSVSVSMSESGTDTRDGHDRESTHPPTDSGASSITIDESKDSLFTTSASSLSGNETPAPTTPPTPAPDDRGDLGARSSAGTGKGSLRRSMLPVLAKHLRRLSLTGTPDRERLVDKFRGLRSLSKPRSRSASGASSGSSSSAGSPPVAVSVNVNVNLWRGSPARSESGQSEREASSPSPVKGSGIPVLQRRMTIRARRTSVRKI